jgi:hypothetical protein
LSSLDEAELRDKANILLPGLGGSLIPSDLLRTYLAYPMRRWRFIRTNPHVMIRPGNSAGMQKATPNRIHPSPSFPQVKVFSLQEKKAECDSCCNLLAH